MHRWQFSRSAEQTMQFSSSSSPINVIFALAKWTLYFSTEWIQLVKTYFSYRIVKFNSARFHYVFSGCRIGLPSLFEVQNGLSKTLVESNVNHTINRTIKIHFNFVSSFEYVRIHTCLIDMLIVVSLSKLKASKVPRYWDFVHFSCMYPFHWWVSKLL